MLHREALQPPQQPGMRYALHATLVPRTRQRRLSFNVRHPPPTGTEGQPGLANLTRPHYEFPVPHSVLKAIHSEGPLRHDRHTKKSKDCMPCYVGMYVRAHTYACDPRVPQSCAEHLVLA